MKRTHPQVLASKPYDGFHFYPVNQRERSHEKVQQEEIPARFQAHFSSTPSRKRGL